MSGKARHDIAQPDDGAQDALLEDEVEHAQEQQCRRAQHEFRHAPPFARGVGGAGNGRFGALVQNILELRDLSRRIVQLTPIFIAEQDGAGGIAIARLRRGQGGLLLLGQPVDPMQRLLQGIEFARRRPGVLEVRDALFDGAERGLVPAIGDQMGGVPRNGIGAGLLGLAIAVLQQRTGHLVERGALLDGGAFGLLGAGRHQHGRARRQRQRDSGAIGPVGNRG